MTERRDIYLSRNAVKDLAHYAHLIPITQGFSRDFVHKNYPGWEWNDLLPVLLSSGRYDKETRTLRRDLVGVVFTAEGEVIEDDGSLVHPVKPIALEIVESGGAE